MNDADFRPLILAEFDAVFRLACHLTRNRLEADDAVQETYLRALRSSHTFKPGVYGVRPWLFKILHNVIIAHGVKGQRERAVLDDHRAPAIAAMEIAHVDGDGASINWDHIDERLRAAIAELTIPYRATFLLSAVEGMKYHEIAEVTDVPIGTVMSRLSRARETLRSRLSGLAAEQRLDRAAETLSRRVPRKS